MEVGESLANLDSIQFVVVVIVVHLEIVEFKFFLWHLLFGLCLDHILKVLNDVAARQTNNNRNIKRQSQQIQHLPDQKSFSQP